MSVKSINHLNHIHIALKSLSRTLGQEWATLGTRTELGTRELLSGTWARPRKRDLPPFKVSVSLIWFVNNPLFNLTLMCFWCHMATNRAV